MHLSRWRSRAQHFVPFASPPCRPFRDPGWHTTLPPATRAPPLMLWQVVKSATPIRELQAHPETSTASAEVHADDRFYLWPYALRPWLFWPGLLAALYLWLRLSAADWPSLWAPSGALALSFVAIFVALPILVYRLGRTSVLNDTFKHLPASSLQWMRGVAKWRSRALFKTHALLDWIRLRLYCAEPASAVGESCRLTSKSDSKSADDRTPSLLSLVDLRKRAAKWGKETWSKVAEAEPWLRKAAAEWVKEFANRFGRYAPFCSNRLAPHPRPRRAPSHSAGGQGQRQRGCRHTAATLAHDLGQIIPR